MSLQQLFTSRKPYTATTFVAGKGKMFYDETSGALRIGDGTTPGGKPITYPVASTSTIGGIKLGPGVVLNGDNQIVIDSTGLDFAFGDFYAFTNPGASDGACLSSVNADQDINIVSNGTGTVNVIGAFNVHATDGDLETALSAPPIFKVSGDGQVTMLVPKADQSGGALEIVGNDTGLYLAPDQTGVILHITGNSGLTSRSYFDASANYTLLAGRRYNGTQINPTKVLSGEVIFRIAGQAATQATTEPAIFQAFGPARIEWVATQDQQPNKQGGEISIYATANDTAATAAVKVATFNATTGLTATKFNGPLTGNVTGTATTATYAQSFNTGTLVTNAVNATTATNAAYAYSFNTGTLVTNAVNATTATSAKIATTATNLAAATGILAGSLSVDPPAMAGKNVSVVGTYTITGLTTSHKIVVMPQSALPDNFNIGGAWASASNTLSINFQSYAASVDAAAFTIAYFAWV